MLSQSNRGLFKPGIPTFLSPMYPPFNNLMTPRKYPPFVLVAVRQTHLGHAPRRAASGTAFGPSYDTGLSVLRIGMVLPPGKLSMTSGSELDKRRITIFASCDPSISTTEYQVSTNSFSRVNTWRLETLGEGVDNALVIDRLLRASLSRTHGSIRR
jgi:hypothetical protein